MTNRKFIKYLKEVIMQKYRSALKEHFIKQEKFKEATYRPLSQVIYEADELTRLLGQAEAYMDIYNLIKKYKNKRR